jgi:hypothetical protein
MNLLRRFPLLAALAAVGLLGACGEPAEAPRNAIKEGTVLVIQAADANYKSEASRIEAGYVTWTYCWKNRVTGTSKSYRGLVFVFSEEEGHRRWIEVDHAQIDRLFPLEVGRQVPFSGEEHAEHEGLAYPVIGALRVRAKETVILKDQTYETFVIDLALTEKRPGGDRSFVKTMWYAPALELALRTDYVVDGRTYSMKVVDMIEPGGKPGEDSEEPRGLGTVRL